MSVLSGCAVRAAIQSGADESVRDFIAAVWTVVDDSEEDAQSGDVTVDAANWTRLLRALWDLGGRHRERLIDLGWAPPDPDSNEVCDGCRTVYSTNSDGEETCRCPAF